MKGFYLYFVVRQVGSHRCRLAVENVWSGNSFTASLLHCVSLGTLCYRVSAVLIRAFIAESKLIRIHEVIESIHWIIIISR